VQTPTRRENLCSTRENLGSTRESLCSTVEERPFEGRENKSNN
jgi:hypothetical protein